MPAVRLARIGAGGAARGLVTGKLDDNTLRHRGCDLQRVPVGQPDAAMGLRLADLGRVGGAVDAIAFAVQPDPDQPDRIVGTGLDGESLARLDALEGVIGVVAVGRIFRDRGDLESAGRRRLFGAAGSDRIDRDQRFD
jgi:hypothetical protein